MTADQFSNILNRLGLSQAEAARVLDLDRKTIHRYANGDHPIPVVVAWAMKAVLAEGTRP